jgi:hypothetical protein
LPLIVFWNAATGQPQPANLRFPIPATPSDIAAFIAALDNDPDLKGKISYRCMKVRDDANYDHLAAASDEQAVKVLQQREFFKRYTEKTRVVAGGEVSVAPLEIIAETKAQP